MYVLIIRAARPFINEIILLERNPLRAANPRTLTIGRRSFALHTNSGGELFGRWLVSAVFAAGLTAGLVFGVWFASVMLLFNWDWGPAMFHFWIPVSMWTIAGYFSVVRFMMYLDLRIRREGWEVELLMRAASARYVAQLG